MIVTLQQQQCHRATSTTKMAIALFANGNGKDLQSVIANNNATK